MTWMRWLLYHTVLHKLLGRTLGLTAAYKQLAVSPLQNFLRPLVAFDPVLNRPAYFIINALLFGATSSVYSVFMAYGI